MEVEPRLAPDAAGGVVVVVTDVQNEEAVCRGGQQRAVDDWNDRGSEGMKNEVRPEDLRSGRRT